MHLSGIIIPSQIVLCYCAVDLHWCFPPNAPDPAHKVLTIYLDQVCRQKENSGTSRSTTIIHEGVRARFCTITSQTLSLCWTLSGQSILGLSLQQIYRTQSRSAALQPVQNNPRAHTHRSTYTHAHTSTHTCTVCHWPRIHCSVSDDSRWAFQAQGQWGLFTFMRSSSLFVVGLALLILTHSLSLSPPLPKSGTIPADGRAWPLPQ